MLYAHERQVKLQEVDAAGIVYFPRFLEYCHDAYFAWLEAAGIDVVGAVTGGPYLLPLVHAEADFHHPLRFGDRISVEVDTVTPGTSSYAVTYTVWKLGAERTACCTAKTVHAVIDRTTFTPLKRIPDDLLTLFSQS